MIEVYHCRVFETMQPNKLSNNIKNISILSCSYSDNDGLPVQNVIVLLIKL